MSLVGTRPPTVDEWDKYELHHRARLATKPGLTGMWQVSGRSNITDFEEVVKLDKQYISEWTMGLDEEGLQYMRNYYNNHIKTYIDYNVEEYLNLISSDNFNYEEALYILDMDMVNDDKKISLLESTTKPISIMGKNYSDSLIEYILINNFNDRDEKELYQHFSEYDDIIQSAIYRVAETRVDIIIRDKSLILDDMLLSELLEKSSCNKYDKIELWAKAIPNLNEESCKEHFDELGC